MHSANQFWKETTEFWTKTSCLVVSSSDQYIVVFFCADVKVKSDHCDELAELRKYDQTPIYPKMLTRCLTGEGVWKFCFLLQIWKLPFIPQGLELLMGNLEKKTIATSNEELWYCEDFAVYLKVPISFI